MDEITHQIWACEKAALVDYLSKRERVDLSTFDADHKAAISDLWSRDKNPIMSIAGGVATIKIEGVLSKEGPDLIDKLFGFAGSSYTEIGEAVSAAAGNDDVRQIRLEIDSPGGDVFGVDEARTAIAKAADQKEVIAVNTGKIASAAYWLASASTEIVSTAPSNVTGSIGVVAVAIDRTDRDRRWGVVTVVSRNAPDKRPNLQTESGRAVLQDQVDALERVFTKRISEGRGLSVETVEQTFGRGRVMVAADPDSTKATALSVGMIDRVVDGFASVASSPPRDVQAADNVQIEAAGRPAETLEEPPCAAGENDMSEELKARVAELEKLLGSTRSAQDELTARMQAVSPILASDAYPSVIKEIAAKVLAGEEHHKALEGAIAVFDAQKASDEIKVAEQASEGAPVPEPKAVGVPADGSIVSAESLEANVKAMRRALGKE